MGLLAFFFGAGLLNCAFTLFFAQQDTARSSRWAKASAKGSPVHRMIARRSARMDSIFLVGRIGDRLCAQSGRCSYRRTPPAHDEPEFHPRLDRGIGVAALTIAGQARPVPLAMGPSRKTAALVVRLAIAPAIPDVGAVLRAHAAHRHPVRGAALIVEGENAIPSGHAVPFSAGRNERPSMSGIISAPVASSSVGVKSSVETKCSVSTPPGLTTPGQRKMRLQRELFS